MSPRIGYACLVCGQPGLGLKTCTAKTATQDRLYELIDHNLEVLDRMLDYNLRMGIRLFRISSDIIPFGSSPVNTLDWVAGFGDRLSAMGKKAAESGMRLSMHPGQYTVLNSPRADVVERAVLDLRYHTDFLNAMGLDGTHKLILHVGGIYDGKAPATDRFARAYAHLDKDIRRRLIIENDDKLYHIRDLLDLHERTGAPVVYDELHHLTNPPPSAEPAGRWLRLAADTWAESDGPPKVHYSQQAPGKRPGSHSETIGLDAFLPFWERALAVEADVMLEVKDKNLSAVKCLTALHPRPHIKYLERQWSLYKYNVLERDPRAYQDIRGLLKDKSAYPAAEFYRLIDRAMAAEPTRETAMNGLQHVWGYVKTTADDRERSAFLRAMEGFTLGKKSLAQVKAVLRRLAEKYGQDYLLDGYYFTL